MGDHAMQISPEIINLPVRWGGKGVAIVFEGFV
jgi:hypothetical protein